MRRYFFCFFLFLISSTASIAQSVKVECKDIPLDKLLRTFKVEISFDPVQISQYHVTLSDEFDNIKSAIDHLLADKPFVCEIIGNVYVISAKPKEELPIENIPVTLIDFTGVVIDAKTGERLPYTQVVTNQGGFYTDFNGVFKLKILHNETLHLQIHYLGYQVLDSILNFTSNATFALSPITVELKEIKVATYSSAMRMQQGENAGQLRVNHAVSKYLPSVGDNSVYTLLQMMPGVRASGEPSGDLFVWGSGTGESRVVYDGITIYGLRNFNDNIGFVNPFMVKDIRLHKGGYDTSMGGQIGAVAEIIGISGNCEKSTLRANINNLTANILGSIPLSSRTSLTLAYRQTFYSLYDAEKLNPYRQVDSTSQRASLLVIPDYSFRDLNGKVAGKVGKNDSYYLNFYGSVDQFNYTLTNNKRINLEESSVNKQIGSSAGYHKVWNNAGISSITLNYSQLNSSEDKISGLLLLGNSYLNINNTTNRIEEVGASLSHQLDLSSNNKLLVGAQWLAYQTRFNGGEYYLYMPNFNVTNQYLKDKFTLNIGVRIDLPLGLESVVQPRISAGYQLTESFKLTLGAGSYYQAIQHAPQQDSSGAYQLVWMVANNDSLPSLKSNQLVGGLSFQQNKLLVSFEGFIKQSRGIVALNKISQQVIASHVLSKSIGSDLFVKYNNGRLSVFGSASLCQQHIKTVEFQQEYKGGAIISLRPFHISVNYVWGSGFNYLGTASYSDRPFYTTQFNEVYQRLDGAISYRLVAKAFDMQVGFVVLNILDYENLKYRYQVPPSKIISSSVSNLYLDAESFTPTLFLEIAF